MPSKKKGAKKTYKVTNWREYNIALKQRGSLTIWISKEIEDNWYAQRNSDRKLGRQLKYSNQAIQMMLTLRVLFKLPLHQLEGFCRSLFEFGGISLQVKNLAGYLEEVVRLYLGSASQNPKRVHT